MVAEPWLQTHCQQEHPQHKVVPGPQKLHRSHDVNECVAYIEEHPEFKFDCNNKRAVDSAFKNLDSWLKSLCIKGRKQELCDGVNDVAGMTEDVDSYRSDQPFPFAANHTNGHNILDLSCRQSTSQRLFSPFKQVHSGQ